MEFTGHQVLNLARRGGVYVCEVAEVGIKGCKGLGGIIGGLNKLLRLANDE